MVTHLPTIICVTSGLSPQAGCRREVMRATARRRYLTVAGSFCPAQLVALQAELTRQRSLAPVVAHTVRRTNGAVVIVASMGGDALVC